MLEKIIGLNNAIVSVEECNCGAITIGFSNDTAISCQKENMQKYLGFDYDNLMHFVEGSIANKLEVSMCNHCVNHWGVDICSCGSGEPIGECDCGSKEGYQTYNTRGFNKGGWLS